MPIHFRLTEALVGFALTTAGPGEKVQVATRELVPPKDAAKVLELLEQLNRALFSRIPGFPSPWQIGHLVIVIHKNLSGVAYINELQERAQIKAPRDVQLGGPVYRDDMRDIRQIDLGIEIPNDAAVVVLRIQGWRRSLFFDFGPLAPKGAPRNYSLSKVLVQQTLLLFGFVDSSPSTTDLDYRDAGLQRLKNLLKHKCDVEKEYQQVLEDHPWLLGSDYRAAERHTTLDDKRIPDFTAVLAYGGSRDIIELKHPFLPFLRKNGKISSDFNDAWNQALGYLSFVQDERDYLARQKSLLFENARCILYFGYQLGGPERRKLNEFRGVKAITITTYDELVVRAEAMLEGVRAAFDPVPRHIVESERRKAARKTLARPQRAARKKKRSNSKRAPIKKARGKPPRTARRQSA